MTDPDIHQRLHDTHYELQSRYYGYWYGEDLFAYNSQVMKGDTVIVLEYDAQERGNESFVPVVRGHQD